MRKIGIAVIAAGVLLGSSASANFINTDALYAMSIHGGAAMTSADGTSNTATYFGFESNARFGNEEKIVIGLGYTIEDLGGVTDTTMGSVLVKAGYEVISNMDVSLIGGFSLTDNLSGPTMGLAVEYQVLDYVSLEAKYQVSQLDPAVGTGFNVNSLMLGVGLNFRSSK